MRVGFSLILLVLLLGCSHKNHHHKTLKVDRTHALTIDAERVQLTREYFAIHNPSLSIGSADVVDSIRFEPQVVVVHFTSIPTLQEVVDYFKPNRIASDRGTVTANGSLNVGIQYIVDQDGTIYASYPDNVMSRHVIGLNHVSIGIENVGNADLDATEPNKVPLTQAQLEANIKLIRHLKETYPKIKHIIGHMEYRELEDPNHPGHDLFYEEKPKYRTEKIDPGPRFMKALRRGLKQGA